MSPASALFDTAIGACALAWRGDAVIAVQLPESSPAATLALLGERCGAKEGLPPDPVAEATMAMRALLDGEPVDLSFIRIDLGDAPDFARAVYSVTQAIPPGETMTYGQIAKQIGHAGEARAVGQALGRNPVPIIVPCHRVLGSNGKVGGFSANGGVATKLRMLTLERARTSNQPTLFAGADWPLQSGQVRR
ncbi:methylated-DNA--[protein]-cysteine S-methyltransferase [Kaistia dalseonensis]|nr:methylated-DNA--[protein]-cysteine S-methyltransferase [Kaistia dalseonensis]MCX5493847.1 methylated-DNA--[protein]-cysteine S-methyltransferase [Kaistia dalseonensis]